MSAATCVENTIGGAIKCPAELFFVAMGIVAGARSWWSNQSHLVEAAEVAETAQLSMLVTLLIWFASFLPIHGLASNRYILCPGSLPVRSFGGKTVKGFAASVASSEEGVGRMTKPPYLRVALLVDADWDVKLAENKQRQNLEDLGHSTGTSYKKCRNQGLPRNTEVYCRLAKRDGSSNNGTWTLGRLMRYRNAEVSLDFAECDLAAASMRWIHQRNGPGKIKVELRIQHLEAAENPSSSMDRRVLATAVLLFDLCLVRRPLMRLSMCSQALYGFSKLQSQLPWAVEDWLEYHLEYLGVEHAQLYDTDGSLERALKNWSHSPHRHSFVSYHMRWPSVISDDLARLSRDYPYCTEMHAYAHCTTTQRALSRWVLLLHSPDEYVVIKNQKRRRRSLPSLIEDWEASSGMHGRLLGMMTMKGVSFARGGHGSDEGKVASRQRGAILQASMLRSQTYYHHSMILNPEYCACMGAHMCYAKADEDPDPFVNVDWTKDSDALVLFLEPHDIVLHHYTEMMAHDRGRCTALLRPCDFSDRTMEWAAQLLRRSWTLDLRQKKAPGAALCCGLFEAATK